MPDHALICSHAVHVAIILERGFVARGRQSGILRQPGPEYLDGAVHRH